MNPKAFEYGATFIEQVRAAERIETDAECEVQDDFCDGTAVWLVESGGKHWQEAVIACQRCATSIWLHPKANDMDWFAVSEESLSEYDDVIDRFVPVEAYSDDDRLEWGEKHYSDSPTSFAYTNDD